MKLSVFALCLSVFAFSPQVSYAQSYPGYGGGYYDNTTPDGDFALNVAKAKTKITKFTVSWGVQIVMSPWYTVTLNDVNATGEATWNTYHRISYANLYGYYDVLGEINDLKKDSSETSVHYSDLSGYQGNQWVAFRFRLGVWEKGGAKEADSNLRIVRS